MEYTACFDVGGTSIKTALINEEGRIESRGSFDTPSANCKIEIPMSISKIVNEWKKDYKVARVGISTAGNIDRKKGVVIYATSFADYSGAKLVDIVEEETGLKTYIDNDVAAAAIGESGLGGGQGIDNFICMTVGTSIGGSIFINGEIYRGGGGLAGEIGHMTIDRKGKKCNCGRLGCYESYASTSALVNNYRENVEDLEEVDGKYIIEKVRSKDEKAVKVFEEFIYNLGLGLKNIAHILNPEAIIIGGGISEAGDILFAPLTKVFNEEVMDSYKGKTVIKPAELGNDAGLIGMWYTGKKINQKEK